MTGPAPTGRWWAPLAPVTTSVGILAEAGPSDLVALRRAVLRDGRDEPPATYPGDGRASTLHLGLTTPGGRVVGAVTVLHDPWPAVASLHLVGMAVDPHWQRRGVGRDLVGAVQDAAATAGLDVWAAARMAALDFYRRHGFRPLGPEFTGAMGLAHRRVLWRSRTRGPGPTDGGFSSGGDLPMR